MDILLLPIKAIWRLVTIIFELTGRVLALVLGIVLMIVGVIVSLTIVGAVIGIPIALFGLVLTVRGLF
ncbi:MAG: hypothetical protein HY868_13435 [Chloroflexi bacterium]|nr:hypothetical protein [Chloroflexota bacterium]